VERYFAKYIYSGNSGKSAIHQLCCYDLDIRSTRIDGQWIEWLQPILKHMATSLSPNSRVFLDYGNPELTEELFELIT